MSYVTCRELSEEQKDHAVSIIEGLLNTRDALIGVMNALPKHIDKEHYLKLDEVNNSLTDSENVISDGGLKVDDTFTEETYLEFQSYMTIYGDTVLYQSLWTHIG